MLYDHLDVVLLGPVFGIRDLEAHKAAGYQVGPLMDNVNDFGDF